MAKLYFNGKIVSIQPRIRLMRSFDESSHNYLGYAIELEGTMDQREDKFSVGIGKAAQAKFLFKLNDEISGECLPVENPQMEPVSYYKVSKLKKLYQSPQDASSPPWHLPPPPMETYRERRCRRLSARTYDTKCKTCMWAARMPVEIIVDNWNPRDSKIYRYETFCYGPKSCKLYKAGPQRQVPGRGGMVYVEEDWVDEMEVEHRDD